MKQRYRVAALLLSILGAGFVTTAAAADIRVVLIDTRTGEPWPGQVVGLRVGPVPGDRLGPWEKKTTDQNGTAVFNVDDAAKWAGVAVMSDFKLAHCSDWGDHFAVSEIVNQGLVRKNTCGLKGNAKTKKFVAKPGEVVLFSRPLTWWEKL